MHFACGDYTVTVDLKTYRNPWHMRAQSRDCCDGNCSDPCDNRFRFCYSDSEDAVVQNAGVFQERPEEVVVGCQLASGLVAHNNDSIVFPRWGIFGGTVENPLEFRGDVWPVRSEQSHLLCVLSCYL